MNTEKNVLEKCQVELKVSLDAAEVSAVTKEVEKAFMRDVKLPGFRPGKVPLEIIRKQFAQGLQDSIKDAMVRKNIGPAIKAAEIDDVGITDVKDIELGAEGGSFTAVIDVKPVFDCPNYKGLKIAEANTTVADEAVEAALNQMRASYAKFEDAKEGEAVADGDFIQIDYSGAIDGKPVTDLAPEAKVVSEGTGFWTQVEEGRFLPEILAAVKGMKAGETKEGVEAKFDSEAAPDPLKGKTAVYKITLKTFRRRIMPTDAELIERTKEDSIEKLSAKIRETMEKRAVASEAARRENEAVDQILKQCTFDVPQTVVSRTTDSYLQQFSDRAQKSGLSAEYFEKNREAIMKDATDKAVNQVRLWYVIEAIAKAEGIDPEDKEVGKKVIDIILANAAK